MLISINLFNNTFFFFLFSPNLELEFEYININYLYPINITLIQLLNKIVCRLDQLIFVIKINYKHTLKFICIYVQVIFPKHKMYKYSNILRHTLKRITV